MKAIILSTGDELVLGQTVDTNSGWMSRQLAAIGVGVGAHVTVGDSQADILQAMLESVGRCDVLLVSGGIGPTEDDRTRFALAELLGVPLEANEKAMEQLEGYFRKLNRMMPESNRIQAMLPRGVRMLENNAGTASGMDADYQSADKKTNCRIFVMPGVPREMKAMFEKSILTELKKSAGQGIILSKTLHTFGVGESTIGEKLGALMARTRNPSVGTTVANGLVSLRLNARFADRAQAEAELASTEQACRDALNDLIFGADDETLAAVVANLLTGNSSTGLTAGSQQLDDARHRLATRNSTITTAESCTGGLLAKMLTDIPGSSIYFTQGWIVYANAAKHERLGVPTEILNMYGAVSEPVVQHLARNARRLAKADFALAISGIAGPTGGSATKPVGTVCICLAFNKPGVASPEKFFESEFLTRTFVFPGDREFIRDRAAKMALTMLRFHLLGKPLPF